MSDDALDYETGWRMFGLDGDELVPAWARRYWPAKLRPGDRWKWGANRARCLTEAHAAPDPDCTCGIRVVPDLDELLTAGGRRFAGSPVTILEELGVVARVGYIGNTCPGIDMPTDDPPGTVRAELVWLIELNLDRTHRHAEDALRQTYGAPVRFVDSWGDHLDPVKRWETVARRVGLVTDAETYAAWWNVAQLVLDIIRGGCTLEDAVVGIFQSDYAPTYEQAHALVHVTVAALAPDLLATADAGPKVTNGVTLPARFGRATLGLA